MAVAAITPDGSPKRSLALTPRGSAEPYQEDPSRSTQRITAAPGARPATGVNHPQHRCGPGRGAQSTDTPPQTPGSAQKQRRRLRQQWGAARGGSSTVCRREEVRFQGPNIPDAVNNKIRDDVPKKKCENRGNGGKWGGMGQDGGTQPSKDDTSSPISPPFSHGFPVLE